jgi:hypothetical protein
MAEYPVSAENAAEVVWELTKKPMLTWSPLPAALFISAVLTPDAFISGLALGVGTVWSFVWISWIFRWRARYTDLAREYVTPIRLTLSNEGLTVEHQHGSSRLLVSGMKRIHHMKRTVFLYTVTNRYPMILPKKYLSEAELQTIRAWKVRQFG